MPPRNDRRRREQQRTRIPLFARSHPYLYKVFLISAQFTTPLALLTLAAKAGVFQRSLVSPSLSSSTASGSSSGSLWRLPVTSFGTAVPMSFSPMFQSTWRLPINWRKCTVWLWYMSLWSYLARHMLIGSSVVWVLSGWEEDEVEQAQEGQAVGEGAEAERENEIADAVGGADVGDRGHDG